ncbi:MAG: hypothetical protein DDT29_01964 [Dehalococcoidia bacterium]|nr:hypothetical protein [Bacillota bacterium]
MKIVKFRVQMYRCFQDSGWVEVSPLTTLVGKNESGKTALLKALHKFKPFTDESYSMDREWPRAHRGARDQNQVVCWVRFELEDSEKEELSQLVGRDVSPTHVDIGRTYGGTFVIESLHELVPDKWPRKLIEESFGSLPGPQEPVGDTFRQKATELLREARELAFGGRAPELPSLTSGHIAALREVFTPGDPSPQHENEEQYVQQYLSRLNAIASRLASLGSLQQNVQDYLINHIPTFIYMSDYRAFTGSAQLDLVKERMNRNQLTEEDKTLLMIMELAGLNLDEGVQKGNLPDREQRQYDMSDASATLTKTISDHWKQRKYEVQFRADGQLFYTFVKDELDPSLIRLEERSKGFQWFFSFDLMFMYESQGTFKGCVILLDEPGLHLHPNAQSDLLKRMEQYARDNTLIYTTHLPFMIDLATPERIRILSESEKGIVVSEDLTQAQPEAKFVLQAALDMSGRTSYLLSERNLIVEGVDDYWIITELSNLLKRAGRTGLPEDVFITPTGGASEAAYIATFMIGQQLDVVVLLDSDRAGREARDALVKKWLTRYHARQTQILSLGEVVGVPDKEFSVEDLFPEEFYLERVKNVYKRELATANVEEIPLKGSDQLCKRVERAMKELGIEFNKGSVAKVIRAELSHMKDASGLPEETQEKAKKLMTAITAALPEASS